MLVLHARLPPAGKYRPSVHLLSLCSTSHIRSSMWERPPPAEIQTEASADKITAKTDPPPSRSPRLWAPQYRLISYFTAAQCRFSPVFLPPFAPVHLLIYQPAPWCTYYCNVKAGKRPTTGRSASGDWVRDWMALPVSHPSCKNHYINKYRVLKDLLNDSWSFTIWLIVLKCHSPCSQLYRWLLWRWGGD